MSEQLEHWSHSPAEETYMIAGWRQWADAGEVSSGLPEYLVKLTQAEKIGEMAADQSYLFQVPGTHHLLRPEVSLADGHRQSMNPPKNEFFHAGEGNKGLIIFLGEEPHLNVEKYAENFLDAIEILNVRRAVLVAGVYGPVPYDQDREVSCVYSLPGMKDELEEYAVSFSNYEGGVSISTYLVQAAEARDLELFGFHAFVPAYDFAPFSTDVQGVRIEKDFQAWYGLMRRLNHMFKMRIDLSELRRQGELTTIAMKAKIEEMKQQMPDADVSEYMAAVAEQFSTHPFVPFDDIWETELGSIFDDLDDQS